LLELGVDLLLDRAGRLARLAFGNEVFFVEEILLEIVVLELELIDVAKGFARWSELPGIGPCRLDVRVLLEIRLDFPGLGRPGCPETCRSAVAFSAPSTSSAASPRFRLANSRRLAGCSFMTEPEILVFCKPTERTLWSWFQFGFDVAIAPTRISGEDVGAERRVGGMQPFAAGYVSRLARPTMSSAAASVSFRLAAGFGAFGGAPLLDVGGSLGNDAAPVGLGLVRAGLPARLTLGNEISGGREFSWPFAFTPASANRRPPPAAPRRLVEWRRFLISGCGTGVRGTELGYHIQIECSLFFGRWERTRTAGRRGRPATGPGFPWFPFGEGIDFWLRGRLPCDFRASLFGRKRVRDSTAAFFPTPRLVRARSRSGALGPTRREVGVERLRLVRFPLVPLVRKVGDGGSLEALGELALGMGLGFPVRRALIPQMRPAAISPVERLARRRLDTLGCRGRLFVDRGARGYRG